MSIENQFAVGVIGVGNMGAALVRGIVNKSGIEAKKIIICDVDKVKVESLCRDLGVVDGIDANNTS
ncbi:MAG: NAD(P)-binding domain-containing protein, partial [Euryarchaeota archaeon]|nr:NAD(P)-binding domain-containing protein [Euryarchaeota archaeon]MBT7412855.1 NAD(P)-binding domain-containing protein [Euryarchaeota archaeon]